MREVQASNSLEVVILTFNEERNIQSCLRGLQSLRAQVFVVDSGSTDRTLEVVRAAGCLVYTHPFVTHADQWRWTIENLPFTAEWILALDADQVVTPELASSIDAFVRSASLSVGGAYLNRRQVFRGKWIRHGGYYPKYLLKMFRRRSVVLGEDLVDHHFLVEGGTVVLAGDLIEANCNEDEIATWIAKHNRYAVLQAREEVAMANDPVAGRCFGNPDERATFAKSVWRRLPLYLRPFLYFGYRYFVRLGVLDGKQGFIFHFLQAFWYRLLVDINIDEVRRTAAPQAD